MLTDINEEHLKGIGNLGEIENLSPGCFTSSAFPVEGTINQPNNCLMVCLTCQRTKRANAPVMNVWFVVNTAFNCSFVSEETMSKLTGLDRVPSFIRVTIQDPNFVNEGYLSHGNFKHRNVLGMKAMNQLNISIKDMNWKDSSFQIVKQ